MVGPKKRMSAKQKNPPSAIALAVSVAAASQLPVLSLIGQQAETSMDSKKETELGRWAATVGHMEEILQSDPDHGHALMVTLLGFFLSYFKAL